MKVIVFEGIYGSGEFLVNLIGQIRDQLLRQEVKVSEQASPDSVRAMLMDATFISAVRPIGRNFMSDFFFDLHTRAAVCSKIKEDISSGMGVLCKHFTMTSKVYAKLKGHDWVEENLDFMETRARTSGDMEVNPDLTLFLDVPVELAYSKVRYSFRKFSLDIDLNVQRSFYVEEMEKIANGKIVKLDPRTFDQAFAQICEMI